jgi:hypothetical protein
MGDVIFKPRPLYSQGKEPQYPFGDWVADRKVPAPDGNRTPVVTILDDRKMFMNND